MSDALEIDQVDFAERLRADSYFSDITLLIQRKGVTESDIEFALSVLNEKFGKIGACVVLIMPELKASAANVPGPLYDIVQTVQVIEQPSFNLGDTGTGKSAEQIAQRVRQVLHHFCNGFGGTYNFEGMEPIQVDTGKISYGVKFSRRAGDAALARVASPKITTTATAAPATVTLTCATAGASIWYTTDGSYPSAQNPNALLYAATISVNSAKLIRAAAEKTGSLQSNVAQLQIAAAIGEVPSAFSPGFSSGFGS